MRDADPPLTEHDFRNFNKWLGDNGVKTNDTVEVAKFEGMGYGLRAKRDLKVYPLSLFPSSPFLLFFF